MEMQFIFSEIGKPVLKSFADPAEKCRELGIGIVSEFLTKSPNICDHLPYIIPVLVQRLGQPEITEPSEEIRLLLIKLFSEIVELSGKKLAGYVDDSLKILQRTLLDPFPEAKKESCRCASNIAKMIPEHFHMQSESLVKPLLMSITHQHSRVRTVVVETIGDVILYGNGKAVDTVASHLAQRLFDQAPSVRRSVVKVVGSWLLDLPDRYSFHHKLIPLLLTGISDEQPAVQELADTLWHDIGMKYERENEDDIKDNLDFPKLDPDHYPPDVDRPNVGCRLLMSRNLSKILPGLMRDILDWVLETRLKSASLLYTMLLNAEDNMTQHLETILSGMYKAAIDEDAEVVNKVKPSAELVGYFVEPEVWCNMMLTSVKTTQSAGVLMVLAAIIRGSKRASLQPFQCDICTTLMAPEICHTIEVTVQQQLLACVYAITTLMKEDCDSISQHLFTLLLTILALAQDSCTKEQACQQLDLLSSTQSMESCQELYRRHTKALVQTLRDNCIAWTSHSIECCIFDTLMMKTGPVVGELLDDIIPILVMNLNPDKDAEMRLKFFSLLSHLMMNSSATLDAQHNFGDFSVIVLRDIILPNCVWRAGRTAAAIRTTAMSCFWALLQSAIITVDRLEPMVDSVLTQVMSTLDDDNRNTRLISCRVLTRVFDLMGMHLDQDHLHNLYPGMLKRLDDSSDEVRVMMTSTFQAYLACFTRQYDVSLYRAHLEAIYSGLLVHLDDSEERIQQAILATLKKAGELCPAMLASNVAKVKHKHRTTKYCDELLSHFQSHAPLEAS